MLRPLVLTMLGFLTATASQAGQQMQGQQMQGQQLQGQQMQGASLAGADLAAAPASEAPILHRYAGWYSAGLRPLGPAQLVQGQLVVPDRSGRLLAGAALAGVYVPADQGGALVWTQIRAVTPDPTFPDGGTFLYSIDLLAADGSHTPLCRTDVAGVSAAIPVAAEFNDHGDRVESSAHFTFGCTAGVIAKCYRWGYQPWLPASGAGQSFAQLHWACTRLARADYCGDGQSGTFDGTLINVWDRAPAPGPFQDHGAPPLDFVFEAGWSTQGAVCLSKQRWLTLPPEIAARCPDRLIAPGVSTFAGTVCDRESDALGFDSSTALFNESKGNVR